MTADAERLAQALRDIEALLEGWPTMRALSALGAQIATDKKAEARRIIAEALK